MTDTITSVDGLNEWLASAVPGATVTYFTGPSLAGARDKDASKLPTAERERLEDLAGHVLALASAGLLLLTQRRVKGGFEYMAVLSTNAVRAMLAA